MRLPRFRIRTLMVVVAAVAALTAAWVGVVRLQAMSSSYRAQALRHAGIEQTLRHIIATDGMNAPVDISPGPGLRSRRFTALAVAEHEAALQRKYERAARYPWLPVEPDPPVPR